MGIHGSIIKLPEPGRILRCSGSAAWNMALDEALLTLGDRSGSLVLRLYEWRCPTVSLGRFQDTGSSIDLDFCSRSAIEVVRRPTGGRAVYHWHDLTYSLLVSEDALGTRSIMESYRSISGALSRSFEAAGVPLRPGALQAPDARSGSDCFAHVAVSDLAAEGRKLVGSAQVRRGGWILQHGSIRAWTVKIPEGIFCGRSAAVVGVMRGSNIKRASLEEAIARELSGLLGCEWMEDTLSSEEAACVNQLVVRKYDTEGWTIHGRE